LPGDASARPAFRFGQIEDYPLVEQGDPDEGSVFDILIGYKLVLHKCEDDRLERGVEGDDRRIMVVQALQESPPVTDMHDRRPPVQRLLGPFLAGAVELSACRPRARDGA
jgi:hypothetical protein